MTLAQYLAEQPKTVKRVPDDVHDKTYYPEAGTILELNLGTNGVYTLNKVSAPSDPDFPDEWQGAEFIYLPTDSKVDPVIGNHDYRGQERLFGVLKLKGEDFFVWFYIDAADGHCWCAARNTLITVQKNGGWKFDP
ncbi:MAG: hypothetical protein ACI8Z1_001360 [Candidatus Azotimanducaceae bacterium]|jgi:hypothetical protein